MKVQSDSHPDDPTSQHLAHVSRANPTSTGYFAALVPFFRHPCDASFSSELDERTFRWRFSPWPGRNCVSWFVEPTSYLRVGDG
jgi:hypothetical protein